MHSVTRVAVKPCQCGHQGNLLLKQTLRVFSGKVQRLPRESNSATRIDKH